MRLKENKEVEERQRAAVEAHNNKHTSEKPIERLCEQLVHGAKYRKRKGW